MKKPVVSVIIPVYNRAQTIEAAVQSVLAQKDVTFEVILVDDGSRDNSWDVIEHLSKKDVRIKAFTLPENRGAQAARNKGILEANGEWIAFLDSDDEYLPESLSLRLNTAQSQAVQVVHSECYIYTHATQQRKLFGTRPLQGQIYHSLLRAPGPTFPAIMGRKECFVNIGYLDEGITAYQEWDTAIHLAKEYDFGFTPEPTFIYHIHALDNISKSRGKNARAYEHIVQKHQAEIIRWVGKGALGDHYLTLGSLYQKSSEKRTALNYYLKGIWLHPGISSFNFMLRVLMRK